MKNMTKRAILLLLVLALLVACVGCGGGETEQKPVDTPDTSAVPAPTTVDTSERPEPVTTTTTESETESDTIPTAIPTPDTDIDYDKWETSRNWNGTSTFSNTALIDGERGCTIENSVPNHAMMTQLVSVKPNTDYEFTVVFRVEGYQPGEENSGGACINIANPELTVFGGTPRYITSGDVWTSYCYVFNSGNATSVRLCLSNGWFGATSAGTAYFKAITLHSRETNEITPLFQ